MYIMKGEKAYKMKYHTLWNYMYNVKNLSLQNIDYFHLMTDYSFLLVTIKDS